jgi:hypothetical protein
VASDVAAFPPWQEATLRAQTKVAAWGSGCRWAWFNDPTNGLGRFAFARAELDQTRRSGVDLSIAIPVYRGASTVSKLVGTLSALRNSGDVCQESLRHADVALTKVEHARNVGEHNAVITGLRHARSAHVITMDDDLRNPPEEVIRLYDHVQLGRWDVVYTRYAVKHMPDGAISAAVSPTQ